MYKKVDELTSNYPIVPVRRHWDPESEKFTGLDALFYAVRCGWFVSRTVFCEKYLKRENRQVRVFTFIISCQDEVRYMNVIDTPHVMNFIDAAHLDLVCIGAHQPVNAIPLKAQPVFAKVG